MEWFVCCFCKKKKQEMFFFKDKYRQSGFKPRCKECEKLYINRDLRREYEREYWSKHRDKKRISVLKAHRKNKEYYKQKRKDYLKTEKGKMSYKKYTQKRYALKKANIIENIDVKELYEESGRKCAYCNKKLHVKEIHIDHYIPLSKAGQHVKSNLRISCKRCNLSKGNKMPEQWGGYYQMVQT